MESKTVHERLIKTVTSALNAAGVYFAQLFSGCSLGAKASALGAEDRGFKSLHPDFGFRSGVLFVRGFNTCRFSATLASGVLIRPFFYKGLAKAEASAAECLLL